MYKKRVNIYIYASFLSPRFSPDGEIPNRRDHDNKPHHTFTGTTHRIQPVLCSSISIPTAQHAHNLLLRTLSYLPLPVTSHCCATLLSVYVYSTTALLLPSYPATGMLPSSQPRCNRIL